MTEGNKVQYERELQANVRVALESTTPPTLHATRALGIVHMRSNPGSRHLHP